MKKRSRLFVLLVAVVAIGAGGYWFGAIPATAVPQGLESQARFAPGPFDIISESFTAVDESRPTQAYRDFAGRPVRELNGELWRPARAAQAGPLLVYSHGFMSFHQEGLYLVRFLASHGYTVVAVDYPLTGFHAPDGPLMRDIVNQPGDVSFLIDTMLKRNADPADALFATIDPKKIAVAGTSLGGLTSILATFHRQMRDPRIAAAISIAGPTSMFTADFFSRQRCALPDDLRRRRCDRPLRRKCHARPAEESRQYSGLPAGRFTRRLRPARLHPDAIHRQPRWWSAAAR